MGTKLTFRYDREADILHIDKRPPYAEQESEELGDDVIARLNPQNGEIENLEVLFFSHVSPATGASGDSRGGRSAAGHHLARLAGA